MNDQLQTNNSSEILFIGATHGDERIGVDVLRNLQDRRSDFDWIIGNPPALQRGTREYEGDLNRSAPGDPASSQYAQRRACELIELSKKYRYTIDIHGSTQPVGIFVIVTNPNLQNLRLATMLGIKRIVLWPAQSPEMEGPLSEEFPCGVEIECGIKTNPAMQAELQSRIEHFLNHRAHLEKVNWPAELHQRDLYEQIGPLTSDEANGTKGLEEFDEFQLGDEMIAPVFIGSYPYKNIVAYKLKRLTAEQVLRRIK